MLDTEIKGQQVRLKDDILVTSLDDQEGIVLDTDSKSYYLVNETGLFLLNLLQQSDGRAFCSDLKSRMLQEYSVAEDRAERDISEFLRKLNDQCLASLI